MEKAELYALGMLGEDELRRFERELNHNEDLQRYLVELEDSMAAIALTAPQIGPPARVYEAIQDEIESSAVISVRRMPLPWWAAAALVMLSGIAVHQGVKNHSRQNDIEILRASLERERADREQVEIIRERIRRISGKEVTLEEIENVITLAGKKSYQSYTLTQNLGRLEKQLSRLKKSEAQRFTPQSGVSRMVVTKMLDPGLAAEEKERRRVGLTNEVSDIIATGLDGGNDSDDESLSDPESIVLSGRNHLPGSNFIIEEGMVPLGMFDLPEGTTLFHRNFPLDELENFPGILSLPDEQFYDKHNKILWGPGDDGLYEGMRVDERPSEGNIPEFPAPPAPEEASPESPRLDPQAYTLFDETTGEGKIVATDLPAPGKGESYQLWMNDPEDGTLISIGVTEDFDGGNGIIPFQLPRLGVSPTNFQLTLEPAEGSAEPTGPAILSGPE